jgi:uncharacterized protein
MVSLNLNRMWESANAILQKNDVLAMKRLIKSGFPVKSRNQKYFLLVSSAKLGHLEMAKLLLKSGVNINERCLRGNSALDWAIYNNDVSLFEFLVTQKGIDLSKTDPDVGMNALMFAAKIGNESLVQFLLKKGLNPLSKDRFGRNAFFHCKLAEAREEERIKKAKSDFMTDCVFSHPGIAGLKAHLKEIEYPEEFQKILKLMQLHFLKERGMEFAKKLCCQQVS